MRIETIFKRFQTDIKHSLFCDYDVGKDLLVITYTVNNHTYDLVFANIKSLRTAEQRDFLIHVVETNIQYHIVEQENKQQ